MMSLSIAVISRHSYYKGTENQHLYKGERQKLPSIKNSRYLQHRDSIHTLDSNNSMFDHLDDEDPLTNVYLSQPKVSFIKINNVMKIQMTYLF